MPVYKMMLDLEVEATNATIAAQIVLEGLYSGDVANEAVKFVGLSNLTDDEPETSSSISIRDSQYGFGDGPARSGVEAGQTLVQRLSPNPFTINSQGEKE